MVRHKIKKYVRVAPALPVVTRHWWEPALTTSAPATAELTLARQAPIDDLPHTAKGYTPQTFWTRAQMEAKLKEIMDTPRFGNFFRPDRASALGTLRDYMVEHSIGPSIDTEIHGFLNPGR